MVERFCTKEFKGEKESSKIRPFIMQVSLSHPTHVLGVNEVEHDVIYCDGTKFTQKFR